MRALDIVQEFRGLADVARRAAFVVDGERHHPRRMAVRRIRGFGLRHAGRGRALALVALYVVAAVVGDAPGEPRLRELRSSPTAQTGTASRPRATTSRRSTASGWSATSSCRGAAPWLDPYSFQPLVDPQVVLAGWPFGLAFWPLDAALRARGRLEPAAPRDDRRRGAPHLRVAAELQLPSAAACIGGLAFALAPYRLAQSGTHLLGWIAVLLPLALFAYERSRRAERGHERAHALGSLGGRGRRLDPAVGPGPPRARRDPVLRGLRGVQACARCGGLGRRRSARGGRRRARHPPDDRPRVRRERRPVARRRSASSRRVSGRPRQPLDAEPAGAVRLRRLAPPGARRRRRRLPLAKRAPVADHRAGCRGAPAAAARARDEPPRSTRCSGTPSRRSASRGFPGG